MTKRREEHSFSVEMKSGKSVRKMAFSEKENDRIFFEGYLGKLKNVSMIEGMMLEIEGVNGTLRMDISQQELQKSLTPEKKQQTGVSSNE